MTTITALPTTLGKSYRESGSRPVNRRPVVAIAAESRHYNLLPEPPYELWVKGELARHLGVPEDGHNRVEIIGGEIVVSPGPLIDHAKITTEIVHAFVRALDKPGFRWWTLQNGDINLTHIAEGYVPDLIVLDADEFEAASDARAQSLRPQQVALAIEITSKWTAAGDRVPGPRRRKPTKWNGYAREGIEFYLLVDRDPRVARVILFTKPRRAKGDYETSQAWAFGETVVLPEPFGVEIPTDSWRPWGAD
ncbi:MAG TPA: Uma2 family endonuclease [Actinocrinis sp.]|nr:Uma2 family endonuclease [Actinocrinis sp.]